MRPPSATAGGSRKPRLRFWIQAGSSSLALDAAGRFDAKHQVLVELEGHVEPILSGMDRHGDDPQETSARRSDPVVLVADKQPCHPRARVADEEAFLLLPETHRLACPINGVEPVARGLGEPDTDGAREDGLDSVNGKERRPERRGVGDVVEAAGAAPPMTIAPGSAAIRAGP